MNLKKRRKSFLGDITNRNLLQTIMVSTVILLLPLLGASSIANAQLRIGALTLNPGEDGLHSAVIDATSGYAYFGTGTSPGIVVKVRLSGFTRVAALTLDPDEYAVLSATIDPAGGFAYFATNRGRITGSLRGIIVKVRLSDFGRAGSLALDSGEDTPTQALIDCVRGFAYFGTQGGIVVKVRLSDFSRVAALTLNLANREGEYLHPGPAVMDTANGFAYFGTDGERRRIMKVRLTDFTYVGELELRRHPISANHPISAVIDPSGFAYFGTLDYGGKVVKVRLSDFTCVGTLELNLGDGANVPDLFLTGAALIDSVRGFAYFGTETKPGMVVTVRLSDFIRFQRLVLDRGEDDLEVAVIDAEQGFAYFGTGWTYPGRIVKVRIGESLQAFTTASQPVTSTTASLISTAYATETASIWSSLTAPASAAVAIAVLAILGSSVVLRRRKRTVRPLPRPCQSCGFQNPPYAKSFCVKCGNRLDKV